MSIKIMNEVIEAAPVEQGALLVMIMLADSADENSRQCWPSVPTIARRSRLSERQVQYCLKDLAQRGLIEIETNAGRHGTNLYRIARPETWGGAKTAGVKPIAPGGVKPIAPGGVKPIAPEPSLEPSLEPSIRVREELSLFMPDALEAKKDEDQFADFWKAYPIKKGRPAAQKAWAKAIRKTPPQKIIAAAGMYAKSEAVQRGFGKFPQGWLNDERFNDPDLQPVERKFEIGSPEDMAERQRRLGRPQWQGMINQ
jgi:hypothetical protein